MRSKDISMSFFDQLRDYVQDGEPTAALEELSNYVKGLLSTPMGKNDPRPRRWLQQIIMTQASFTFLSRNQRMGIGDAIHNTSMRNQGLVSLLEIIDEI